MKESLVFIKTLGNSLSFVINKKLFLYFIPAIFLSLIFYMAVKGGQSVTGWLEFLEDWWIIGWIVKGLEKTIHIISFVFFEFLILVLLTPINSYFAEKVKEDLTGVKTEFDFNQLIRSLWRSIKIFGIAFSIEMIALFFIWILSFFLGDWFYYVSAMLISSFFIGFSFFDFGLDLEKVSSKESWKWGLKNKWLCLLSGLIFSLTIYLPEESGLTFLFVISISLVPHLLTIASTKTYYAKKAESN